MSQMLRAGEPRTEAWGTEYTDNFGWDQANASTTYRTMQASGLLDGRENTCASMGWELTDGATGQSAMARDLDTQARDPSSFPSEIYTSVYRETIIRKDDRGHYIDPFKNITTKASGRRLMYDTSHPDKMYPSMPSSELADHPGCYSFPTTTGLEPSIPFTQDLQWQSNAEVGHWPTDYWKNWTKQGVSPVYDGHDDQVEYSKLKVHVP